MTRVLKCKYQIYKRISDGMEIKLRPSNSGYYTEDDKLIPRSVLRRFYVWQRPESGGRVKPSVIYKTNLNGFKVRLTKREMDLLDLPRVF